MLKHRGSFENFKTCCSPSPYQDLLKHEPRLNQSCETVPFRHVLKDFSYFSFFMWFSLRLISKFTKCTYVTQKLFFPKKSMHFSMNPVLQYFTLAHLVLIWTQLGFNREIARSLLCIQELKKLPSKSNEDVVSALYFAWYPQLSPSGLNMMAI